MINQRTFVDTVERYIDAIIAMQQHASNGDSAKEHARRASVLAAKDKLHLQLHALYGLALAKGAEMGRTALLEEQAEERARKRRAAKRRTAKKRAK